MNDISASPSAIYPDERLEAIQRVIRQLDDKAFAQQLVHAYSEDTDFLVRTIWEREIRIPVSILQQTGKETDYTRAFGVNFDALAPVGKVAVVLPSNGINMTMAKAVASSFLAGNSTLVKLPRKLRRSAPYFRDLIESNLPGVSFSPDTQPSETFLTQCIVSPDISTIVIYGDDKWIGGYKDMVRRYRKKLIFEGPGKDPQIVLPGADIELAVADAVKCGLLNGGQSCSAMERFFVHKEIAGEFIERLTDGLAQIRIGDPFDEKSGLGPVRSAFVLSSTVLKRSIWRPPWRRL